MPFVVQIPLSSASYPTWTLDLMLPPNTAFEYKFIRKETDGSVSRAFDAEPCTIYEQEKC